MTISPSKIILFGSYATKSFTDESDIDLLIIKNTSLPMNKRSGEILKLSRGMKLPLDVIVYTQEEVEKWSGIKGSFLHRILSDGKVIYEH